MFEATRENLMHGRCQRYGVLEAGRPLPFREVLELWQENDDFVAFFVDLLETSPFAVYRWETPPVTADGIGRPFEFVIVDSPEIDAEADPSPFQRYFVSEGTGIVAFENLGGDALLVVPSPRTDEAAYGHLAAFVRKAPADQVRDLWASVGRAMLQRIGERPVWLSTAGGGVAWLHVRLDSRPKYYAYRPYKAL